MIKKISTISILVMLAFILVVIVAFAAKPNNPGKPGNPPANPEITYVKVVSTAVGLDRDLYVMDADGGNQTLIASAKKPPKGYDDPTGTPDAWVGYYDPAWSPDKTQIVVVEEDPTHTCQGTAGWWQMKVLDVAVVDGVPKVTGERTIIDCNHIKTAGNMRQPAWSHDGTKILFTLFPRQIRTIAPDGYNDSVLVWHSDNDYPNGAIIHDVAWNADGNKIAYSAAATRLGDVVRVVDLTTGVSDEAMPPKNYVFNYIDWSHDSSFIAFGGHQYGIPSPSTDTSLWKFDPGIGASSTQRVKYMMGNDISEVNWTPDDAKYVYGVSVSGGYQEIWEYDPAADKITVLGSDRRHNLMEPDM